MSFINVIFWILCIGGLIYFSLARLKEKSPGIIEYREKHYRFYKLEMLINAIELDNKYILDQIKSTDLTESLDPVFTDKLIKYSDDEDNLKEFKKEKKEIEKWLRNAKKYDHIKELIHYER